MTLEDCFHEEINAIHKQADSNGRKALWTLVSVLVAIIGFFAVQVYNHVTLALPSLNKTQMEQIIGDVLDKKISAPNQQYQKEAVGRE